MNNTSKDSTKIFNKIIKQRTLLITGSKLVTFLTNSMEQSACCEANGSLANQEIPFILRKAKAHTAFVRARYLSLFRTRLIQSTPLSHF